MSLHAIFFSGFRIGAEKFYMFNIYHHETHKELRSQEISFHLEHFPKNKMATISHIQIHFHEWKVLYLDSNLTKIRSQGSNWQWVSIGSGNGLALNRQQAITWTNANPVHRRIYAALGGEELMDTKVDHKLPSDSSPLQQYHEKQQSRHSYVYAEIIVQLTTVSWVTKEFHQTPHTSRTSCATFHQEMTWLWNIQAWPIEDVPPGNDRTWEIQGAHLIPGPICCKLP